VTHYIARLMRMPDAYRPSLSYSDLTPEEQRLVQIGLGCSAVLLWFAVALVNPWLLAVVPALAAVGVWLLRRRRARRTELGEDTEDWTY
jgi:predicted membrane metal-binding protein